MVNHNGILQQTDHCLSADNRGLLFGDAVFETLKIIDSKILFWEDHYFRLMASMRILRMEIPMSFTMEQLESEIIATALANNCESQGRVRITIYRNAGGFYKPMTNDISYFIQAQKTANRQYSTDFATYEVDLYKDFCVARTLLSTLKTNNKALYVTASIYAAENDLQNCLIINDLKNVVEATNGNLFMILGNKIITPPLSEGCLNGIMRKQVIKIIAKMPDYELVEEPISPFDLQKADELFLTNAIFGIQPISKYRKKDFVNSVSKIVVNALNESLNIS